MSPAMTTMDRFGIEQRWTDYTSEQHAVWSLLYGRRMESLTQTASRLFLTGLETIGLNPNAIPDLREVNQRLAPVTGWNAVPVSGFIPADAFFSLLAERRFPTTITVRPRSQLDYLPEPDIFHDVFGHVPLHADSAFADYLQRFGVLASQASSDRDTERMARLFWFTIEFGLIRENGAVRIYGSGLISSHADANHALGPDCDRRPFSLDAVFDQPFEIDRMQEVLFVVDSFVELFEALDQVAGWVGET